MTNPYRVETVYLFIRDYVAEHKTGPLFQEIEAGCGLTKWEARRCISILVQQKRIRKTFRQRSISPVEVPESQVRLTAMGERERAYKPSGMVFD